MEENKNTQTQTTPDESKNEGKGGVKTFTQDEVNKLVGETRKEVREQLSKEFDEKLNTTIEDFTKKIEQEKLEAERKAKLSEQERVEEERKMREKELSEKDTQLKLRENRLTAIEKLDELKIPIKLVDFVVTTDGKEMEKRISALKESFDSAVQEAVESRLDGKTQKDITTQKSSENKTLRRVF